MCDLDVVKVCLFYWVENNKVNNFSYLYFWPSGCIKVGHEHDANYSGCNLFGSARACRARRAVEPERPTQ